MAFVRPCLVNSAEASTSFQFINKILSGSKYSGKKIAIDYSSPNIAKPFHIGHLRSTFLGRFLGNIIREGGGKVTKINFLGDHGTQFGLLAIGFRKFAPKTIDTKISIELLNNVYVKANAEAETDTEFVDEVRSFCAALENKEETALKFWTQVRQCSLEYLQNFYHRLNVDFDLWQSESEFVESAKHFIKDNLEKGVLFQADNGLIGVKVPKSKRHQKFADADFHLIPLAKSDLTSLYLTRDVMAALNRCDDLGFDQILYVVENGQTDHFEDLKCVLNHLNRSDVAEKINHVKFGMIRGISTRRGNVISVEEMLNQGKQIALDVLKQSPFTKSPENEFEFLAEKMAIGAFLINDFHRPRTVGYYYDWEKILKPTGDRSYLLQACHARLCSLEERFPNLGLQQQDQFDLEVLVEDQAKNLLRHLNELMAPDLKNSLDSLDASHFVRNLYELAHRANACHKFLKVDGQSEQVANARMKLFRETRKLLGDSLNLLGVEPLRKL